jgi:hypothetical protein
MVTKLVTEHNPLLAPALDTSAQLDQNTSQGFSKKTFLKRARSKNLTNKVVQPLSKVRSPLEKSYRMTLLCSATLTQARGKITGLYCNQRWCLVCSRIRTAKLIAGYIPALEQMEEKYFVTLTVPNCKGVVLKDTIKRMFDEYVNIRRSITRTHKLKYAALRKFECTNNLVRRDFHPHFHVIVDSELAGNLIIDMWLKRWPAATREAQDIRPADDNSCMELFKYFTKVISKTTTDGKSDYSINLAALDTIFRAMKGKRTFQPSGCIKTVSEDVEPEQAELAPSDLEACWSWLETDWIDKETGELLSGYEPSEAIKNITDKVFAENQEGGTFGTLLQSTEFTISPTDGTKTS